MFITYNMNGSSIQPMQCVTVILLIMYFQYTYSHLFPASWMLMSVVNAVRIENVTSDSFLLFLLMRQIRL